MIAPWRSRGMRFRRSRISCSAVRALPARNSEPASACISEITAGSPAGASSRALRRSGMAPVSSPSALAAMPRRRWCWKSAFRSSVSGEDCASSARAASAFAGSGLNCSSTLTMSATERGGGASAGVGSGAGDGCCAAAGSATSVAASSVTMLDRKACRTRSAASRRVLILAILVLLPRAHWYHRGHSDLIH